MAEVLAQIAAPPEPWQLRTGSDGLSSVQLAAPLVVRYSTGGSPDTLPAHTPATVYGSSATTFDAAADVYVLLTVPGSSTLQVVKESQLSTVSGSWAGIGRVLQHAVVPYAPGGVGGGVAALEFLLDGAGSIIPTGVAGSLVVPFSSTLLAAEVLADQVGSIVVDVWKSDYSGYPPSSSNTICASTPPTISSAHKSQDTALSGWTTALTAGDVLMYDVVSCSAITRASVVLLVQQG